MKYKTLFTLAAIVSLFATGCQPGQSTRTSQATTAENEPDLATTMSDPQLIALNAKDELFKQLSTRLIAAMSNGGPAAAIEVCSREAPKIAAAVGKSHGVALGRTSFKLRNSRNEPPAWAQALVEKKVSDAQFVELPDGGTGALLPIMLKSQCLACHGATDQIADDVQAKLAELYPDDQATGFKEGDLRGWFWVVVPSGAKSQSVASDDGGAAGQE